MRFIAAAFLLFHFSAGAEAQVPGVGAKEIVFGNASAFSGTSQELGRQMKIGIETAFMAVNEAGGVNGRQLRLLTVDHGNEPQRALDAVKDFVANKRVFAFIGNTGSAAVEVYFNYLLDQKVILFGSLSGAPFLRNDPPDRYVFNFRASYPEEGAAAVRHLVAVRRIPPTEIAFFAQEDAYGESGWKGFAWQMRRYGFDTSKTIRTGYQRNSTDVTEAVKKITANPRIKGVVCFGTHKLVAKLIAKLQGKGIVFTNASAVEAQELADELRALGPQFMQNVVLTQVVPPPTSSATVVIRYRDQLKKYHPAERPDFLSLQAWLATQVLIEGLKRAGENLDTEKLVDALETIRGLDLGIGVSMGFGPSEHQASHKIWGLELQPIGTWTPIELE